MSWDFFDNSDENGVLHVKSNDADGRDDARGKVSERVNQKLKTKN